MDRKNLLQFLSLPIICSAVSNANFSSSAHIQCANFSCTQIFISITTRDELAQEVWAHLRYSRSTNTLWGATHLMQVWWFPKKHPHFSCTMWTNQRSSLPLPSSFLALLWTRTWPGPTVTPIWVYSHTFCTCFEVYCIYWMRNLQSRLETTSSWNTENTDVKTGINAHMK